MHYSVGGLVPNGSYEVTATMNYQTVAPRFAYDLFTYDLPEVAEFQSYYEQMDLSPIPIATVEQTISSNAIKTQTPESHLLVQAYPNPFNPETNIQISLPGAGNINLTIFNLQGKRMIEIQRTNQIKGWFEYTWGGRDSRGRHLEAGIYLVHVDFRETGSPTSFRADHKLVYLK